MGFGQIVPVFLLALLIFAAIESIYGITRPKSFEELGWQKATGYRDALEEIATQSTVAHATETVASWHEPADSESFAASSADIAEAQEVGSQQSEHFAVDATETSQSMFVKEPVLSHSLNEVEDITAVPDAENPSVTQSEGVDGENATHHESADESHGQEEHDNQDQNRGDLFVPQNLNRTFSTGNDVPPHLDEVLLRPIYSTPTKDQARARQTQGKPSLETSKGISSPSALSKSIASLEGYRSPTRNDTEARMGISISDAEALFNAVQENPKSLLARFIREDLFEIPEVHGVILTYAFFIIALQTILAFATRLILGDAVFFITGSLYICMEIRHWIELYTRLKRIKALGSKTTDLQQ